MDGRPIFAPVALAAAIVAGIGPSSAADSHGSISGVKGLSPSPRAGAAMAADPRHNIVLFGGWVDDANLGDTWTWEGTGWTEQHPADSPSPRGEAMMAYDAARRQTLLFGGFDGTYFQDTWTWDGTNWMERHPPTTPNVVSPSGIAYDAARQQVVLFRGGISEGGTWGWDGVDWAQLDEGLDPEFREAPGMAYDAARQRILLYGGESCFEWCSALKDTWTWNGLDWTEQSPPVSPGFRSRMGMAYDATRRRVVVFGGYSPSCCGRDTWVWNGQEWRRLHPSTTPPARASMAMAWDAARRQIVLFGGSENDDFGNYRYFGDTWTWDGLTWTEQ